jgi:chromosome partitioning protein
VKIIACYNIKGGVGKTATAVNLSYLSARQGWRTLLWDLDPQAAASFYFRVEPHVKKGAKGIVRKKHALQEHIKGTNYPGLDIIPADFSYRHFERYLDAAKKSTGRLKKLLHPLADEYDVLFIDCAPSISLLSENIFQAADALLVPVIPTILSIRTLKQLLDFMRKQELDILKVLPFFSMVDRRRSLHRTIIENPPFKQTLMLKSWIPYASEVEKMGEYREPLLAYSSHCPSAVAYQALWDEIIQTSIV